MCDQCHAMQQRSGVGREELGWAAVIVLVVAGAAFLSVPRNAISTTTSVSSVSGTGGSLGPGTLNSFQTYQELNQFITSNAKNTQQYQMRNGVSWGVGGPVAGGIAQVPGVVNGIASTTTVAGVAASVNSLSDSG